MFFSLRFQGCVKVPRERIREKGHVSRWPSIAATGVPSAKVMGMNARLLESVADSWCPLNRGPDVHPHRLVPT